MKSFLAIAATLVLVSCATAQDPSGPVCPQAGLLPGADTLPIFAQGASKDDIKVRGTIGKFQGACRHKKDGTVDFQLNIDFMATRTEKAGELKSLRFPYFIATLSPDETVLQKERFWIKIDFDNKNTVVEKVEHDVVIPTPGADKAGDYKLVFGFELTKDQLDFNTGRNLIPEEK